MEYLLDVFISAYIFLEDENFWEPVQVGLEKSHVDSFSKVEDFNECPICMETRETSKRLPCCKKTVCTECTLKWFALSVKCPFCVSDLRDHVKK